jgi:hypothetical protein
MRNRTFLQMTVTAMNRGEAVIHGLSKTTMTQVMASGLVDSNLDTHNDNERTP